jgi:hypothetical protein
MPSMHGTSAATVQDFELFADLVPPPCSFHVVGCCGCFCDDYALPTCRFQCLLVCLHIHFSDERHTGGAVADCSGTGIERIEEVCGATRVRHKSTVVEAATRGSASTHQDAAAGASAHRPLSDVAVADLDDRNPVPGSPDFDREDVAFMKHAGALDQVYSMVQTGTQAANIPWCPRSTRGGHAVDVSDETRQAVAAQVHASVSGSSLTWSEEAMGRLIVEQSLTVQQARALLGVVTHPRFDGQDIQRTTSATLCAHQFTDIHEGIHMAKLHDADLDGTNDMDLHYRTALECCISIVQDPALCAGMEWSLNTGHTHPETGARCYPTMAAGRWLEAAYAEFGDDPELTILGVVPGSDAFKSGPRGARQPMYVTIGNLLPQYRRKLCAWKLAGFVPILDVERMCRDDKGRLPAKAKVQRRKRLVLNQTAYHVLESLIAHAATGGQVIFCGDGVWRKILFLFQQYATDNQEHETLLMTWAHRCFLCDAPHRTHWQVCTLMVSGVEDTHAYCTPAHAV